jgi:hypothetical protein
LWASRLDSGSKEHNCGMKKKTFAVARPAAPMLFADRTVDNNSRRPYIFFLKGKNPNSWTFTHPFPLACVLSDV